MLGIWSHGGQGPPCTREEGQGALLGQRGKMSLEEQGAMQGDKPISPDANLNKSSLSVIKNLPPSPGSK